MKTGVIYCYHINNKYYVGKTCDKESKRKKLIVNIILDF